MGKNSEVEDIFKKYGSKIEQRMKGFNSKKINFSKDYVKFKSEMAPEVSRYEKLCNSLGSMIKIKASPENEIKIKRKFEIAHIDLEPWKAVSLSVVVFLGVFFLGFVLSVAYALLNGGLSNFPILFFLIISALSIFLYYFVNDYPSRLANKWRLKASSQMVPAILYVVVYMRHTPNLEKSIAFASQHLQYLLALDFKKVFYDVSVGKFSTMKESLDNYLETWRDYSTEFIESFHLIESSLFEPSQAGRVSTLEKSLQVVLDGVYDKMVKFTHSVRSPITNVYMLGVVLPTLGLALLPLASAMIGDLIKWYHVFLLFTLIVPFAVFYLTNKILLLRPGGYGDTTLLERNPLYPKYKSNKYYFYAFLIVLPLFILGSLPLIFQYTPIPEYLGLQKDYTFAELGLNFLGNEKLFYFVSSGTSVTGPFGIGALFLSMFIPLGVALFFSIAYNAKTKELIKERDKTEQLENEFNNSLFQLGNRIGNGAPPELAFGKVAESSRGLMTEDFFRRVNYNIYQMGMSVEDAIFNPKRGAINYYPSDLIATSMKILIESSKKGLKIAALSLMSISEYVKNIRKITDRLKDLLAEIISDMKSNMTFLAPLLSGIVVGLASMMTAILSRLNLSELSGETLGGLGGFEGILQIFDFTKMIPPYFLQISIGIYLVEIIFILSSTLVTIDSGEDKLKKTNRTGKNLRTSMLLYFIVSFIATAIMFVLVSIVLSGLS